MWRSPNHPLLTFRSSPEFDRPGAVGFEQSPEPDCLPCGLLPFGVFLPTGSHSPRGSALWVTGAFPAFHTLSRLSSTHYLPALFHAGPALGVSPSGSISLVKHSALSSIFTLLWLANLAVTAPTVSFLTNT